MQYQYKLFKEFVILFLCFHIANAKAACEFYSSEPVIELTIRYGKVFYNNQKSSSEFPVILDANTKGLTVSNLNQKINADSIISPQRDGSFCIYLEKIYATVGFPKIDIYIDKKYQPGSCNYKVIKEHEEYHARVQQEGLKFFAPKIRKAFKIAANNAKPQHATSRQQAERIATELLMNVQKQVMPTLQFVQKRLKEENMVIDTKESYEAETRKCPKW